MGTRGFGVYVPAEAKPQGSKRAFVNRAMGRAQVVESSKGVGPYRDSVRHALIDAMGDETMLVGPVKVDVTFWFRRPKSHYGTGKNRNRLKESAPVMHTQRPDIDKLLRATLDALTGYAYMDDCQVREVSARKLWSSMSSEVMINVEELDEARPTRLVHADGTPDDA